jgi:hypothetical protein
MKVTIDLTPEDVRKLIAGKISNECSKHGHPAGMEPKILVSNTHGVHVENLELKDLNMSVHAEVEVA